jgi:hypothetical protein
MTKAVTARTWQGPKQAVADQIRGGVGDAGLHVTQYQLPELRVLLREGYDGIPQKQ